MSAENLPVTVDGGARLDPDTLAGVLPEKLPSGISTKFCIGMAVLRACETVPDNWPPALVRRTSHSPQKREPGTRVPALSKFRRRVGRLVAEPPAPRPVPEGLLPGPRVLQPEVGRRSALTRILRRAGNAMTRETRSGFFGSRPASLI